MTTEELFKLHKPLVYTILHKYNQAYNDDAISYGYEGLYNAIKNYNSELGYSFSTYAYVCINNNVLTYLRSIRKEYDTVSYEDAIEYEEASFDTHKQSMQYSNLAKVKVLVKGLYLQKTGVDKKILRLWIGSRFTMKQKDIADKVGCSQCNVSKCINKFRKDLKYKLEVQI